MFAFRNMNALARWIFSRTPKVAVTICDDAFFFQRPGAAESLRIGAYVGVKLQDGNILAVGDDAREWEAHPLLQKVRVLESGAVVDIAGAVEILRKGFRQIFPSRFSRPLVIAATSVSGDRADPLRQAVLQAGARKIWLIESPMAALIGIAPETTQKPEPSAVLIVSNDWFVFAITSLSNIIATCRGKFGVEDMVSDIRIHCRQTRDFLPDEKQIAAAVLRHGFSEPGDSSAEGWTTWLGKAGVGERTTRVIDAKCVHDGALPTILRISERIKTLLESLPVETRAKLHSTTIEGTGCGMEIPGFARILESQLGIRIRSNAGTEQPALAGALRAIAELPKLPYKRLK